MHAWDGYALSKGIVKGLDPNLYPTEEEREQLRKRRDGNP